MPEPIRAPQASFVDYLSFLARIAVGGVLFYAGFMKAIAPAAEFAAVIDTYRLLPVEFLMPVAVALPWIEMWIGTFLIAGFETRYSAVASATLFGGFLLFLGSAILRKIDLTSCGCFGTNLLSPKETLGMDVVLLLLSIALASTAASRAWSFDRWLRPR
jgi:hypothetical protein